MRKGLTIAFATRRFTPETGRYIRHLKQTCGVKQVEVLYAVNPGRHSLARLYNQFLAQASYNTVCLIHDDLRFDRASCWGQQVIKCFAQYPDYAAFSAAGSVSLRAHGVYWDPLQEMAGRIRHQIGGKLVENFYSEAFQAPLEALILDGLFLAIHKQRCRTRFDERIPGFHFYDIAFSLNQSLAGAQSAQNRAKNQTGRCGVLTGLGITHLSGGDTGPSFEQARLRFLSLYGKYLPLQLKPDLQLKKLIAPTRGPKVLVLIRQHPEHSAAALISQFNKSAYQSFKIQVLAGHWQSFQTEVTQAAAKTDAELILLLDSRVTALQDWLPLMVLRFQQYPQLGTLGIRLHYPDTHLLFHNGLKLFKHPNGQLDVSFRGIHSPYLYRNALEWNPDGSLAYALMLRRQDLLQMGELGQQDWAPGLELNIRLKALGRRHAVESRLAGYWLGSDEAEPSSQRAYQHFLSVINKPLNLSQL